MEVTIKDCFDNDTQGVGLERKIYMHKEPGKKSKDDIEITLKLCLPWNTYKYKYFAYLPSCKFSSHACYSIIKNYKGMQEKMGLPNMSSEEFFNLEKSVKIGIEPIISDVLYIYLENNIPNKKHFLENNNLHKIAEELGITLVFREEEYRKFREKHMKVLAFISHDSRDKELIAKPIFESIRSKLYNVWYDEFSLQIGDNLRESIEKGIKESGKCILILTPNFLNNPGWTKKEFDSIFTKELIEKKNVVLPIWHNVSVEDVYNYSPSLANTVALHWPDKSKMEETEYNTAIARIMRQIINQLV